ncbi:MAG: adenylyltransferase/cytidyltransferase family protein [Oscillospiraceae bacterium]|nr:adenylyltransferase/cytidyltransferase family protein [Oscillospiraceae bacterium]
MTKVITYGTYDLLHFGHIRLLERAKALGDYLIVGVTSDDYDKSRGKINVQQTLMERIEALRATGIADEIIVEEYEGQKIDDIRKYEIDIFTVGSDWVGVFDYLNEYCKVIYLDRTQGISSSELRNQERKLRLGIVGNSKYLVKMVSEASYVNGIELSGICTTIPDVMTKAISILPMLTKQYEVLLEHSDAVYIHSLPKEHYAQIKQALENGKHVLCESPIVMQTDQWEELHALAKEKNCILMEALRTAYSTAFQRLLLIAKGGKIGKVISIDATCTSLSHFHPKLIDSSWSSITSWAPTALLPIFQILGTEYTAKQMIAQFADTAYNFDIFAKISFIYAHAIASLKVGMGVKSEGELVISGTKGYIYVPAPWWKTDYFEVRYENPADNKRYFYQLDGEGIRSELAAFARAVQNNKSNIQITKNISKEICQIMEDFSDRKKVIVI